jgi:hypothetical protein
VVDGVHCRPALAGELSGGLAGELSGGLAGELSGGRGPALTGELSGGWGPLPSGRRVFCLLIEKNMLQTNFLTTLYSFLFHILLIHVDYFLPIFLLSTSSIFYNNFLFTFLSNFLALPVQPLFCHLIKNNFL